MQLINERVFRADQDESITTLGLQYVLFSKSTCNYMIRILSDLKTDIIVSRLMLGTYS